MGPVRAGVLVCLLISALASHSAHGIGVRAEQKISALEGGLEAPLRRSDFFGTGVAGIGDLDGDGVPDLAVGATQDRREGSVWILFLKRDGTVKGHRQIAEGVGGFTGVLERLDRFGTALAALGDLDGDGVMDLAVGAAGDNSGGGSFGAVWILFLHRDGTVKAHQKISAIDGGLDPALGPAWFGTAIESLGDLDGDGTPEIAVGQPLNRETGTFRGAVWILSLNANGTVQASRKITEGSSGFVGPLQDRDNFGSALAALPPPPGSAAASRLVVGADRGTSPDDERGAIWVLDLNADGSVAAEQKIAPGVGGFVGNLDPDAHFGSAAAFLGDLDGDGLGDVAVGAPDAGFGHPPGSVWLLFPRADGSLDAQLEVTRAAGGFEGTLSLGDFFGASADRIGDVDGDGVADLAVGAIGDDDGADRTGAVWILFLEDDPPVCGDAARGPREACDDGNIRSGDLCSSTCELESFLGLIGVATGGKVRVRVDDIPITVTTAEGDSAAAVVAGLAEAINGDPALGLRGIRAQAVGGFLSTNGTLTSLAVEDPGLERRGSSLEVFGSPEGGSIELIVNDVALVVATDELESRAEIARNLAIAINLDPALAGMGVVAFNEGNTLVTGGTVLVRLNTDPGLDVLPDVPGVTALAVDGSPTPIGGTYDFDDNDAFIRPSRALMDAAGRVYFRTRIASGPHGDALFRAVGNEVAAFVLPGHPAPGTGGGAILDFLYDPSGFGGVGAVTAVSPDGELAFYANVAGGTARWGVFAHDGTTTRPIAIQGDAAPGLGGALWSIVLPFAINDGGEVVVFASLTDGRFGLYLVSDAGAIPLAEHGAPVPGTEGTFDFFFVTPSVAINDAGDVALTTTVQGGSAEEALLLGPADALAPLLLAGDPAPGFVDAVFRCTPHPDVFACLEPSFGEVSLDEAGQVAFRGNVQESETGFYRGGMFRVGGGEVEAVAVDLDPLPGSDRVFIHIAMGPPALNEAGDLGFLGSVDIPGPGSFFANGVFVRSEGEMPEERQLSGSPAPGTGGLLFTRFAPPLGMDATGRRLSAVANIAITGLYPDVGFYGLFRFTRNESPAADAGPDRELECSSPLGATVLLDGRDSSDPDLDPLEFQWSGPFFSVSGATASVELPLGRSEVVLDVTDDFDGADRDALGVSVVDSQAPELAASLRPMQRRGWWWGWLRSFAPYLVHVACSDACDATPHVRASFGGRPVEDQDLVFARPGRHVPRLVVECSDAAGNVTSSVIRPHRGFGRD